MNRILILAFAAVAALAAVQTARAVDIVNQDDTDYVITITEDGEERTFTLSAGDDEDGICNACSLSIDGGDPVSAEGEDVIIVRGGKLSKGSG